MKLYAIVPIVIIGLSIYFVFTLNVFPEKYLDAPQFEPSPYFEVTLSDSEINLDESFTIQIKSENIGDYGDIHIVSVAFPTLSELDDIVKITNYDMSHSPLMIDVGQEIGSNYTGGIETILAQYPSIEAMNRPVPAGSEFNMSLLITPDTPGPFVMYVKSVDIPHTSDASHYPREGLLDHQNEFVTEFVVNVNQQSDAR